MYSKVIRLYIYIYSFQKQILKTNQPPNQSPTLPPTTENTSLQSPPIAQDFNSIDPGQIALLGFSLVCLVPLKYFYLNIPQVLLTRMLKTEPISIQTSSVIHGDLMNDKNKTKVWGIILESSFCCTFYKESFPKSLHS